MPANMVLIGAAYQHGVLPMSADAIEDAIRLNGSAVESTLTAFRWGRAAALDAAAVDAALGHPAARGRRGRLRPRRRSPRTSPTASSPSVLATRIADLTGYQDRGYAARYAEEVRRVTAIATDRAGHAAGQRIGLAYARGLHKLMAYKDEYEVARLHLDPVEVAQPRGRVRPRRPASSVLLHPPALRAMGMQRKLKIDGRAAGPMFRALRAARKLRGTPLDVFGRAEVREVERALIGEYQSAVRAALAAGTVDQVVAVAETADLVRGYEDIKLANVAKFRSRVAELLAGLG